MKLIILLTLFITYLNADLSKINSFEADFIQTVEDEKGKVLSYDGHIIASKPQYALWKYTEPVKKDIYISLYKLTVIEPEIEQVIIRGISSEFDFFHMVQQAKLIAPNRYETYIQNTKYIITSTKKNTIKSIGYMDELGNKIKIEFTNETINKEIDTKIFVPNIPIGYDIIEG